MIRMQYLASQARSQFNARLVLPKRSLVGSHRHGQAAQEKPDLKSVVQKIDNIEDTQQNQNEKHSYRYDDNEAICCINDAINI